MLLRLKVLRFSFAATRPFTFPTVATNKLRGAIGKSLWDRGDDAYARHFRQTRIGGPSGLNDPPRPFVLRAAHLNGVRVDSAFEFSLHLFDFGSETAVVDATKAFSFAKLLGVEQEVIELAAEPVDVSSVRVRFVTPMELKVRGGLAERPDFGTLAARIRDRVSTLRGLYGEGPLEIDFAGSGERAAQIEMPHCNIRRVEAERRSGHTGQMHSLGGFVGEAEYCGALAEFIPYLRAAQWTGVGRQTTWGKGAIELADPLL